MWVVMMDAGLHISLHVICVFLHSMKRWQWPDTYIPYMYGFVSLQAHSHVLCLIIGFAL